MTSSSNDRKTESTGAAGDLVGRSDELALACRQVVHESRHLTLWGAGGVGKTSLARATLRSCGASFEGGAFFVSLAGARTGTDLVASVADTIGVRGAGPRTPAQAVLRVARSLAARGRTLVVLDNVEQIVADAAATLRVWTSNAPETSFLVTSRELLAIPGEHPFEVVPLATEAPAGLVPEAVRLLLERARALRPSFDADLDVLREIARRLDGIPLALELAAARLAVMSAEQLLERLDDRFSVLRRGHGDAARRQRTLHETFEWSWNLLDETERAVLAALSIFRGGFDLEAATAVLGADVLDTVAALRHKSLVAPMTTSGADSSPRFFLLESIRELAASKLGERASDVRRAHASYFADRAAAWAARVEGLASESALASLALEHENILAVAELCPECPVDALRAIVALEAPLTLRGASNELVSLLSRALGSVPPSALPRRLRVRAHTVQAAALLALGQMNDAHAAVTQALELAESDVERARVLSVLGQVRQEQGHFTDAMKHAAEALAHATRAGARREQGQALAVLALIHHVANLFEVARGHYEQSLVLLREVGDLRGQIRTHLRLGFLLHDLGDPSAALAQYAAAERLGFAHRIGLFEGTMRGYIGNAHRAEGRIGEALAAYGVAIERLRLSGERRFEATFMMDRGIAFVLARRFVEASKDLDAALAVTKEIGANHLGSLVCGYAVVARASLGDFAEARRAESECSAAAGTNATLLELLDLHHAYLELSERQDGALERARDRLAALGAAPLGQHRRLAADLLRRLADRVGPPDGALVLRDGRLRAAAGTWIDLERRPAFAGVVGLLVATRLASPGKVVSTGDLVAAGWPGERLIERAGMNRLRVLVNALRTEGLKDVLRSAGGGYLLDPSVPVVSD